MKKTLILVAFLAIISSVQAGLVTGGDDTKAVFDQTITTLELPKFNGNLADLISVYVEVEFRLFGAVVEVDNDSVTSGSAAAKVHSSFVTFNSSVNLLKDNFDTINAGDFGIVEQQIFNLGATTGDTDVQFNATGNADYGIYNPGTIIRSDSGNISSFVWSSYIGSGNFTIQLEANYLTGATFNGGKGYFQGITPNSEIYAKVVYTHIPEPMTIALLGLGCLVFRVRI